MDIIISEKPEQCNLCGQEKGIVREVWLTHSHSGEFNNEVRLSVSAYIPYGTAQGKVCEDCMRSALQRSGLCKPPREPFSGELIPDAH